MTMKSTLIRSGLEVLCLTGTYRLMRPLVGGIGVILMLHRVRPPRSDRFQPNRQLEVTPDYLDCVVKELSRLEIDLVSLDEMHRRLTEGDYRRRFACLTFDDGYRDNNQWAIPILKAARVPFAIYVATSFADRSGKLWWHMLEAVIAQNTRIVLTIDGKERQLECAGQAEKHQLFEALCHWVRAISSERALPKIISELATRYELDPTSVCNDLCMDWREIREVAQDPLATIGVHTVEHPLLAGNSEAKLRSEFEMSRAAIEKSVGVAAQHLAYPFGDRKAAGPREFRIAAELGFKTAVTTRAGMLFKAHAAHLMALPRIALNGAYQDPRFVPVLMSGAPTALWNGFRRIDVS